MTNREKVFNFIKNNDKNSVEILDFCEENNINYAYFIDYKDMFSYFDEESYECFSRNMIDILCKTGEIITILD